MTQPGSEEAFDQDGGDGSRDYADVADAARELGGRPPLPGGEELIHPLEESEDVAAAVDDDAPVPELAETPETESQEPPSSRSTRSE